MRRLLREESGFTLVELIIAGALTIILMGGLADLFASGIRASADASSRLTSQNSVRLAFDRLEYEGHCADTATLLNKTGSDGTGVYLDLPSQCSHANGTYSWCVSGGVLSRYTTNNCSGTGQVFIRNVTSATPFCLATTTGQYPLLEAALTVDTVSATADKFSATDTIDMHNAALATSTSSCP